MSKQCLNCGREISGVGNNKIFCDDCFNLIASFLQEIRSENEPATTVFRKNLDRIRAAGISEEAEKYIEKCCIRYDSKKNAAGAAAGAGAVGAAAGAAMRSEAPAPQANIPTPEPAPEMPRRRVNAQPQASSEFGEMPDPFASIRGEDTVNSAAADLGSPKKARPPQKVRPQRRVYDFDADTAPIDENAASILASVGIGLGEGGESGENQAPVTPDPASFDAALYAGVPGLGSNDSNDDEGGETKTAAAIGIGAAAAGAAVGAAAAGSHAAAGRAPRPRPTSSPSGASGSAGPRTSGSRPTQSGGGSGSGGSGGGGRGGNDDDDDGARRRLILICIAAALALILFIVLIVSGFMGNKKPSAGETDDSTRRPTHTSAETKRPENTTAPGTDGQTTTAPETDTTTDPPVTGTHTGTDHIWVNATCTDPKRCTICGATEGEPLGHDWRAEFIWTNGNRTCVVNLTCTRDDSHMDTKSAVVTSESTTATCTEAGGTIYTATLEYDGKTFTDKKEDIPPTAPGHDWGDPTFTWSDDYSSCTATFVCKRDSSHKENVKAEITSAAGGDTCEGAGSVTYTATVSHDGKKFTDKKTKPGTGTGLGHDWGTPTFDWSDDLSSCTATFVCKRDSSHKEEVVAKITVTGGDATCTSGGNVTYTATATLDGKTYTDTKTKKSDALGHDWGDPTFDWADDASSCTVTFTCKRDDSHKEVLKATVGKPTDVKEADCTTPGSATYTATVEFNGETYSETKTFQTPALGHDFTSDPLKCSRCGKAPASILGIGDTGKVYGCDLSVTVTNIRVDVAGDGYIRLDVEYSVQNNSSEEAEKEGGFRLYFKDGSYIESDLEKQEEISPNKVEDRRISFKFAADKEPLFLEYRSNSDYCKYGSTSQYYSDHPERALYWMPPEH